MKKIKLIFLFFFVLIDLSFPSSIFAQAIDPQYIFVRKDNTCQNCILWNGNNPENYSTAAINEIVNAVGTKGTSTRRLGVGALFEPNWIDINKTKQSLINLLNTSLANDFPVYLSLDNFNWWEGRPDLWNWWDPSKPGYNPDNRNNVEWTDWDGVSNNDHVVKLSWTNWGSQFRRPPAPNLLSPGYISSSENNLAQLLPIVVNWYNRLPDDKKYLLGGVDMGNEIDVGGNYYFYANGNSYLDKNPANDPNPANFLASTIQTGFAALKTGGIKSAGTITTDDLNQVVNQYLSTMTKFAFDAGIPRNKIFNHTGGRGSSPEWVYPTYPAFTDLRSSLMSNAQPGWSFYGDMTANPQNNTLLVSALDQINKTQWAVPEWRTFATDYNGWVAALRNTLNYRNNVFLNVANWEQIRSMPYAVTAIKTVLNEVPTCWTMKPLAGNANISGNTVTLNWQKGANNDAVYLNVSTKAEYNVDGTYKTVDIENSNVTGQTTWTKSGLGNRKYYWELIADGCTNQRKIAEGSFVVAKPGDISGPNNIPDGYVDMYDFNKMQADFGNPYTIFDYNMLVGNFGK